MWTEQKDEISGRQLGVTALPLVVFVADLFPPTNDQREKLLVGGLKAPARLGPVEAVRLQIGRPVGDQLIGTEIGHGVHEIFQLRLLRFSLQWFC